MLRKIIATILLAFVIVAVANLVLRGRSLPAQPSPVAETKPAPPSAAAPARLVAFYFHGNKRCASCNAIEKQTREALKDEIAGGRIEVRTVNVDEPANAHYVEDFQLSMRTVVLAAEADGKVARWKRLDECWDRFRDPEEFTAYIQGSLAGFRDAPPATP